MKVSSFIRTATLLALGIADCQSGDKKAAPVGWNTVQDADDRVAVVEGLAGPEAVRYDPEQDVYFVSNFNGDAAGDANGFVSRITADGQIESLKYMTGTAQYPMHGPRGMFIVGDTLWAADAVGIHGFDRHTGDHLSFIDFSSLDPGFINDLSQAADGDLYATDTGKSRLYRIRDGVPSIVAALEVRPNGITWDEQNQRFILAPWGGSESITAISPGDSVAVEIGRSTGTNVDGLEIVDSRLLISSQSDNRIHFVDNGVGREVIRTTGRPADIGIDTKRNRIAVPYVADNRVDIWALPR